MHTLQKTAGLLAEEYSLYIIEKHDQKIKEALGKN